MYNNDNNTHGLVIADHVDVVVVTYQATRSFRVLFIASVRPPLRHVAQLVIQPAGIVVVVR